MIDLDDLHLKTVAAGTLLDAVCLRPWDNPNPIDPFAYINHQAPPAATEFNGGLASAGLTGGAYSWLTDPGSSGLTGQP